jgi:diamine N-acetyltransferase
MANTCTKPCRWQKFTRHHMQIEAKNNQQVFLRRLNSNDLDNLFHYLQNLSTETKKRFGPHNFDKQSIVDFYDLNTNLGYVAHTVDKKEIIAYSIIKIGYLEHDGLRLQSYGLAPDNKTDCTFAPSVADLWQSCGIGNHLFRFILSDLTATEIERFILWGGVQMDNERAVNFYRKNGFKTLGQFTYNGENYDMIYNYRQTEIIKKI